MTEQKNQRSAGVLLHPTSLPGPYGIGALGPAAFSWIDALVHARQKWWQILPLGPTGFGDSPYQCFSAFAGNPLLISPQFLTQDGLINPADMEGLRFSQTTVEYGPVQTFKNRMLARAWESFQAGRAPRWRLPSPSLTSSRRAGWTITLCSWPSRRRRAAKAGRNGPPPCGAASPPRWPQAQRDLAGSIGSHKFRQFLFFRQWQAVRTYAQGRGIRIIGDIPIFVSGDSADVWANPQLFMLDAERRPTFVAGVPPDYFSATGQLWGNPLYNWEALTASKFAWWSARLKSTLQLVDVIRLDHFRGFESYWEIPASAPTAQTGRWVKAPGPTLLKALREALGGLPLIAEDLGIITPEVEALRDSFGLPGMRILQFAFGGAADNPYLPHNYTSAPSLTPAPTTTTRRAAGLPRRPNVSATTSAATWAATATTSPGTSCGPPGRRWPITPSHRSRTSSTSIRPRG